MTETEIFSLFQIFHNQHQIPSPLFKENPIIWTLLTGAWFNCHMTSVTQGTVLANYILAAVTSYMHLDEQLAPMLLQQHLSVTTAWLDSACGTVTSTRVSTSRLEYLDVGISTKLIRFRTPGQHPKLLDWTFYQ